MWNGRNAPSVPAGGVGADVGRRFSRLALAGRSRAGFLGALSPLFVATAAFTRTPPPPRGQMFVCSLLGAAYLGAALTAGMQFLRLVQRGAPWTTQKVRPSVRPSVCPSVRPSIDPSAARLCQSGGGGLA